MTSLEKILNLISVKGLKEIEFTQLVGLSKATVSEWKNGRTKSYKKHLPKIAEVLGVTPEELLDDPEENKVGSPQMIANNVEYICKVLDQDLEDIIIQSGMGEENFNKLKKGISPTMQMLESLSDMLRVPISVLLGFEKFNIEKYSPYKFVTESDQHKILEYYFRLNAEDRDYIKGEMIRLYRKQQEK